MVDRLTDDFAADEVLVDNINGSYATVEYLVKQCNCGRLPGPDDFQTKGGMPVIISRINLINGLGPVLHMLKNRFHAP